LATMNSSKSCSMGSTFRPFMLQVGAFDISLLSSKSSLTNIGDGVWSSISSFEPDSSVVSYSNSTLASEEGTSEASEYVMIGTSLDNLEALGCKSSSGVTERIFSRVNFPYSMVH
jgi:hypothetical protein